MDSTRHDGPHVIPTPVVSGEHRLRVLILGATRFVGRALVDASLGVGHDATLFNHGQQTRISFPRSRRSEAIGHQIFLGWQAGNGMSCSMLRRRNPLWFSARWKRSEAQLIDMS